MTALNAGNAESAEDVLEFWFGPPDGPPLANAARWWAKDAEFDRKVKERFGSLLERGVRDELESWRTTPRGRLGLVVLFDQLSRNMFRGTARSFAQDARAREIAEQATSLGDSHTLRPMEAAFLLMPWMHAEDLVLQRRCIEGFRSLAGAVSPGDPVHEALNGSLRFAELHAAIIERFGRFPHRNEILGRSSTDQEIEFLKQPNSSF